MGPVINNTMLEQLVNLTESVHTLINQSEININDVREHAPYTVPVPMFNYFLCSLITLMVVVLIVVLYSYFFVWVLKGNLDLPNPGGGYPKRPTPMAYLVNPLPGIKKAFNRGTGIEIENSTIQPPDSSVESAQESLRHRNQQANPDQLNNIPEEGDAGQSRLSTIFETKKSGVCEGFKQFKQFKYEQHDDEPEEVVFDAYDIQH